MSVGPGAAFPDAVDTDLREHLLQERRAEVESISITWSGGFQEAPVGVNFQAKFELGPGVEWASEWANGSYVELRKQGEADCVDYYRLHSDRQGGFEWKGPPSEPGTYVFVLRSSGDPWPAQFAEQTIQFT